MVIFSLAAPENINLSRDENPYTLSMYLMGYF